VAALEPLFGGELEESGGDLVTDVEYQREGALPVALLQQL